MNSNAAAILARAASIGSAPADAHGRSKVPSPKTSEPDQTKLCQ